MHDKWFQLRIHEFFIFHTTAKRWGQEAWKLMTSIQKKNDKATYQKGWNISMKIYLRQADEECGKRELFT